jgi:hypothetical protein
MQRVSPLEKYNVFDREDPIARLMVHYFYVADFVHRDFKRVERLLKLQKRRTRWRSSQESCYMRLWLSTLYTTAEGYKELKLDDVKINSLISEPHFDRLRVFRNGTFHYQKSPMKLVQFLSGHGDAHSWAEHLHQSFENFFREYPNQ